MNLTTKQIAAIPRSLATKTQYQIAEMYGVTQPTISEHISRLRAQGIQCADNRAGRAQNPNTEEIIRLRKAGMTLQSIGDRFGLSRERVRQITKLTFTELKALGHNNYKARRNAAKNKS